MTTKDSVSDHVRTLIKNIHTDNLQKKVYNVAAAMELLRLMKGLDAQAMHALVNFYSKVSDVPWECVQFSFTTAVLQRGKEVIRQYAKKPLDPDKVARILLKAISVFSDILAESPDEATQEVFDAVVAELADNYIEEPAGKPAPEIFQPAMLDRCFKAAPVDEAMCEKLKVRPVVYTGYHGVRHRGFAFGAAPINVLLETGELVECSDPAAIVDDECANVPPVLSLYLQLLFRYNMLGEYTTVNINGVSADLSPLEDVFDKAIKADMLGGSGATGPTGASLRFPVPSSEMEIVIDAAVTPNGPYVVSRLMHGDQVIMRHECPRENSALGVYVFPLPDHLIYLVPSND